MTRAQMDNGIPRATDRCIPYADWLNLKVKLLWCYDHDVQSDRNCTPCPELQDGYSAAWFVRTGFAEIAASQSVIRATPGQWLIADDGNVSRGFGEPTHLLSVAFDARWPDGKRLLEEGLPIVVDGSQQPALERKARKLSRLTAMPPARWDTRRKPVDCGTFLQLNAGVSDWFVTLVEMLAAQGIHPRIPHETDPRVVRAIRSLDAHPLGSCLDQEELAAQAGLSLVHLIRLFREDLGTTPRQYFETRRVVQAKALLELPGARVKEVAYGLGFKYLSHFSAWFRKRADQTPRDYMTRRQNRT